MNNIDFSKLREKLSSQDIIRILQKYGIEPHFETEKYIIYPTICHNLSGGSNKLYYYKDNKMFKCYTECNSTFDIFELLIKINALRGNNISIFEAIKITDIKINNILENTNDVENDINYLYNILHTKNIDIKLPTLNKDILNRFIFNKNILQIWVDEGISFETMKKYHILYDDIENCIIIPNYDIDNNLISIRGRFLSEDAAAKYKPIIYGGQVLSHPSSLSLFGININKNAIKTKQKAIIFESEKSVMMMDTIYKNNNISVATLGKNISNTQIKLLLKLGVNEVILAYDADYSNFKELENKRKEYIKIGQTLKNYFNTSIIIDFNMNILNYKDSPIDKGQEKFEQLLKNRMYI